MNPNRALWLSWWTEHNRRDCHHFWGQVSLGTFAPRAFNLNIRNPTFEAITQIPCGLHSERCPRSPHLPSTQLSQCSRAGSRHVCEEALSWSQPPSNYNSIRSWARTAFDPVNPWIQEQNIIVRHCFKVFCYSVIDKHMKLKSETLRIIPETSSIFIFHI